MAVVTGRGAQALPSKYLPQFAHLWKELEAEIEEFESDQMAFVVNRRKTAPGMVEPSSNTSDAVDTGDKLYLSKSLSPKAHARFTQRMPGHGVQSAYCFRMEDVDGEIFDFASLKGKITIVVNVASH